MLAANCPRCGQPAPVSLGAPDTIACHHCGRMDSTPEALAAELGRAAGALVATPAGKRQLTALQRSIIGSRALGCANTGFVWLFTFGLLLNSASCALDQDTPRWVAILSLLPALSLIASGSFASIWLRRQRDKLVRRFAALPPPRPDHKPRCHVCGSPLGTQPEQTFARCGFCYADNVVSPEATQRGSVHPTPVLGDYEQHVLRVAGGPRTAGTFVKLLVLGFAVVAPVVTLVLTVAGGLALDHVRVATNDTRSYATWETEDGRCLARVIEDTKTTLDFGQPPPRGAKETLTVSKGRELDYVQPQQLVGKKVYHDGTVATVTSVFRALGSKANSLELDVQGVTMTVPIAGLCLAEAPYPDQLAKIDERGNQHLVVSGTSLFWAHEGKIWTLPVDGGEPSTQLDHRGEILVLDADDTRLYFGDASGVFVADRATGAVKTLDQTPAPATVRDLCLDATHVYYAAGNEIRRVPKDGKSEPKKIAASEDAYGLVVHDGKLLFHSVKKGSVFSVPVEGGEVATVIGSQKIAAALPLYVVGNRVTFATTSHQLQEVPLKKGKSKRVASLGQAPAGYVRHGIDVFYWFHASPKDRGGGLVHQRVTAAGKSANLVPTLGKVVGFAFDGKHAYWIDEVSGRVQRITRPAAPEPTKRLLPEIRVKPPKPAGSNRAE